MLVRTVQIVRNVPGAARPPENCFAVSRESGRNVCLILAPMARLAKGSGAMPVVPYLGLGAPEEAACVPRYAITVWCVIV